LGGIPPEYLPPHEAWAERVYTLPEFGAYPHEMVFVDSVPRAQGPARPDKGKPLRRVLRAAAV
jgi:hypothetical protein